jgi:hypothetical protein
LAWHNTSDSIWCGVRKDSIIGPYFFTESALMGNMYFDSLCTPGSRFVAIQIYHLPTVWCHPHWSPKVQEPLSDTFLYHWIWHNRSAWWLSCLLHVTTFYGNKSRTEYIRWM